MLNMDMDLSLNEEFCELATEKIQECLSQMQRHWAECSASNIMKRKEWTEVLTLISKAPLKFKILRLRSQISTMWEKCFISQKDRDQFSAFYSSDYTEDLLEKHKYVLEKLNAYYVQHKELIDVIAKYEEMWKSVLSIQERSNDPERLFKNRGAALLKEEQDRKLISKIPVMQKTILKALQKKELEGVVFLIRGQHFSDIIKNHFFKKEEKKCLKRTPDVNCITFGPSSKRNRTADHNGVSSTTTTKNERSKVVKHLHMH